MNIQNNSLYRHYKGKLYYVVGEALDATGDRESMMVVYHALYADNEMFVRDKEEFLSEAPQSKKNVTGQKLRFELYQE